MDRQIKYQIKWNPGLQFLLEKYILLGLLSISFIFPIILYIKNEEIIPPLIWCGISLSFYSLIRAVVLRNHSRKKIIKMIVNENLTTLYYVANSPEIKESILPSQKVKLELIETWAPRHTHRQIIIRHKKEYYYCLENSGLWDQEYQLQRMYKTLKNFIPNSKYIKK